MNEKLTYENEVTIKQPGIIMMSIFCCSKEDKILLKSTLKKPNNFLKCPVTENINGMGYVPSRNKLKYSGVHKDFPENP